MITLTVIAEKWLFKNGEKLKSTDSGFAIKLKFVLWLEM